MWVGKHCTNRALFGKRRRHADSEHMQEIVYFNDRIVIVQIKMVKCICWSFDEITPALVQFRPVPFSGSWSSSVRLTIDVLGFSATSIEMLHCNLKTHILIQILSVSLSLSFPLSVSVSLPLSVFISFSVSVSLSVYLWIRVAITCRVDKITEHSHWQG